MKPIVIIVILVGVFMVFLGIQQMILQLIRKFEPMVIYEMQQEILKQLEGINNTPKLMISSELQRICLEHCSRDPCTIANDIDLWLDFVGCYLELERRIKAPISKTHST